MDSVKHNIDVFTQFEALVEKMGYGVLDFRHDIYDKKIASTTLFGKKKVKYKDNMLALTDIGRRVKDAVDDSKSDKNTKLSFQVEVKNGRIDSVTWLSELKILHKDRDPII